MYGTPSEINYGYQILSDGKTSGVNATTVYRDVNGTTNAFAVIVHFSMPGMFGIEVASNLKYTTIELETTIMASDKATEGIFTVRVEPPSQA